MQKNHIGKFLAVGIIVLFISVCIHPVFAVGDKTSINNENPVISSGEVYENTNCFIMGSVGEVFNQVSSGEGYIVFGWKFQGEFHQSGGWIYTNGNNGKWLYHSRFNGDFYGDVSSYTVKHFFTGDEITLYIGIEGFKGLAFGGKNHGYYEPYGGHCWFIGRAEHVKIRSA